VPEVRVAAVPLHLPDGERVRVPRHEPRLLREVRPRPEEPSPGCDPLAVRWLRQRVQLHHRQSDVALFRLHPNGGNMKDEEKRAPRGHKRHRTTMRMREDVREALEARAAAAGRTASAELERILVRALKVKEPTS
jgi:hypothetical protein